MPIPFPQANPEQTDVQDSSQMQPASSTADTYLFRGLQTVNDSFIGQAYRGATGAIKQNDGSEIISKDDAHNQYGNGGLTTFDGPVSRDYAQFKSSQDALKAGLQDSLDRGGSSSASKTWLGFGVSTAAGLLDPFSDAAAVLSDGITKFAPVGKLIGSIESPLGRRLASGLAKATAFSGLTEPAHYALDDNWSVDEAAQRLGSGALFLGLTEGLFGHTPLKFYSEDKDVPSPTEVATQNLLEDHLQPETKAAMAEASVARAMSGKDFDPINDLVGLDPRIVEHEAKLGGVELPLEERAQVLASMDDGTYVDPSLPVAKVESSEVAPVNNALVPFVKPNSGGVNLEVNFPPSDKVTNDLKEASEDPFVAAVAKASGVNKVSIDSPHTFELSQQGGVTRGGDIRINPDATDAKGTLLHELGHVVWDKSDDLQKQQILAILRNHLHEIAPAYHNLNDSHLREEAIAELFRLDSLTDSEKAQLTEPRKGASEKIVATQAKKLAAEPSPTKVRPWGKAGMDTYITHKDDLQAMATKYGDRPLVMKDVNGGRHTIMASKMGQLLKDPRFSGYVREIYQHQNPEATENLDQRTLPHLQNLKKSLSDSGLFQLSGSVKPEVLTKGRVSDLQRKVSSETERTTQTLSIGKSDEMPEATSKEAEEQLKTYETKPEKVEGEEPKETPSEKINNEEDARQPGYEQAIRCVVGAE